MCPAKRTRNDQRSLTKLFQKPHIALEKQLYVIHAILQNRDSLNAHAKCKSGKSSRIIIDKSIYVRINHSAAQQLNPSAGLAVAARSAIPHTFAIAEDATDLHIGGRLGERA